MPTWLDPATSALTYEPSLGFTTSPTTYQVFSRPISAGTVSLGGNNATGAVGASDMYLVGLSFGP